MFYVLSILNRVGLDGLGHGLRLETRDKGRGKHFILISTGSCYNFLCPFSV